MEPTIIDYTVSIDLINNQLRDLMDTIIALKYVSEQTNYLIIFLFGVILAIAVVSILKGLK